MELPYTKTAEEVLDFFKVREEDGLSVEEVEILRKQYGHNGEYLVTVNTVLDGIWSRPFATSIYRVVWAGSMGWGKNSLDVDKLCRL